MNLPPHIFLLVTILSAFALGLLVARIYYTWRFNKQSKIYRTEQANLGDSFLMLRNARTLGMLWRIDDDADDANPPELIGDTDLQKHFASLLGCPADKIYETLVMGNETLKAQIKALRTNGSSFETFAHSLEIAGETDGANAILLLRQAPVNYGARGTNSFSFPVFICNSEGQLLWGNKAFLNAVEITNIEDAVKENARLDSKIATDILDALKGKHVTDTRAISIDGKRRMMRIFLAPIYDRIIGAAIDIEDEYARNEILVREARANLETLNQLTDAVAVFDASRELKTYNHAFARLWGFEESYLDEAPTHSEILDRLRERARLPHQRNYIEWRNAEMAYYQTTQAIPDETWSLPDGRILRVMRQRQPTGGLLVLYEDISDKTLLQAQFKTQIEVQRTTLDKLREGIAVFSSDGKLTLANVSFRKMWQLDDAAMDEHRDFAALAQNLKTLYGDENFWDELWARVCDPSPEGRRETQGSIERNDGTYLTWLTRPLPDGATLVAFVDVTAHHKIEALLREKALALTEADRLKTSFLEKVSYQLRTPLNTILGYSDLLTSGFSGELSDIQTEQMKFIKQAGEQLETMVGHLLDLAIIDAGQAALELGDVDVKDAITTIAETSTTKLNETTFNLVIDCPDNVGKIRGDDKRFRQIVANLLGNAMRNAVAGDEITIGAKRIGESVKLFIESPNHSNLGLFGNFDFDAFTEGSKRGGLGLVLVKKFVEMHGGWVAIDLSNNEKLRINCHFPVVAKEQIANPELELI